ncbi:unnamed protein product [Lactuca saligna]|uniref:SWIM-type domain-containing protein n=1 Tax=Lactuca saligna TaxID=75948 RepID=A0AA35VGM6_LACSI|nr:unnamed protein product [Lactuca saligna]
MRFKDPSQLKSMLCNYAVANGYQLCFEKNDRKRLLVKCCKGKCSFRLWASWMSDEASFQIKSLKPVHKCVRNYKLGSMVTYASIGSHCTREFLLRQKMSVRKLRPYVSQKFGIHVSVGQCRRAKKYALQLIDGTLVEHYAKLWSYAEEIRRSNPSSTMKLDVNHMPDGKNYFSKFYVWFDALKKGWKEGCRKIIGLNGCFLKGICKGELLCAVGRDANNGIYPITWAVVCVENKENWRWFLDLLIDDLGLNLGYGYSVISDQHKGLIEAVKELLPYVEYRQCAKHISQNLRKRYSGAQYESIFWKACKATTKVDFKVAMKELEVLDPSAHQYLMDKDPKTWSRAYFQPGRCCDAVENGMSESFNVVIVNARKKPIITMLEELRMYMMERVFKKKCKGPGWGNQICPTIREIVNDINKGLRHYQVLPSGLNQFEVRGTTIAYEVDLEERTCSCRLWQLNGIGCVHSVATISFMNRDVESYVDKMFSSITYMKAYKFRLAPMNGSNLWPATDYTPPLPPVRRAMPGRPATKRKRMQQKPQTSQGVAEALNEDESNQSNAVNGGGTVNDGGEAVNDGGAVTHGGELVNDGGAVNHGAEAVNKVHVQQDYDEVELTPLEFDASASREPIQVHVQEQEARETPLATQLKKIMRKKAERIIKLKLGKKVGGNDAPGNSEAKHVTLE